MELINHELFKFEIILLTFQSKQLASVGQWEQGCSLFMATDLGPVRATRRRKKKKKKSKQLLQRV